MSRAQKDRRASRSRLAAVGFGFLVCVGSLCGLAGAALAQSEDQVKAAFLFNFARYVEWPASAFTAAEAPVRICVLGARTFAGVVEEVVAGKQVGDRSVEVAETRDLEGAARCHILFVGEDLEIERPQLVSTLADAHVFTVSDSEGFAREGGVANFFRADQKMRFEINSDAAKRAGLKISSRLLRLARVVE